MRRQSPLSVTIDTVAPVAPVISNNTVSPTNVVTLNGTAEANSTVTVFDGTTQLGTATANASGAWSYATAALPSRQSQLHSEGYGCGRQYRCSLFRAEPNVNRSGTPVNLVANGSFETGDFSGWTLGGNYVRARAEI